MSNKQNQPEVDKQPMPAEESAPGEEPAPAQELPKSNECGITDEELKVIDMIGVYFHQMLGPLKL